MHNNYCYSNSSPLGEETFLYYNVTPFGIFPKKWNTFIYSLCPSALYFIAQKLQKVSESNYLDLKK